MGTDATYKKEHERRRFSFFISCSQWFSKLLANRGKFLLWCIFLFIWVVLLFMAFQNDGDGAIPASGSFLRSLLRSSSLSSSSSCLVSFGKYHGIEYTTPPEGQEGVNGGGGGGRTLGKPKCLVESKFMKLQLHRVQLPSSSAGSSSVVIEDWLWIDYHERINVLVQAPNSVDHFWVFEQSKYALEGRTSLAVVGGMIEPGGESPEQAARREVAEEMNVSCRNFHFLGRYRTDVNRGAGWTNTFLATKCEKLTDTEQRNMMIDNSGKKEVVGAADTERQDLRTLSLQELRQALVAGRFLEIQWSATVALALLHPELVQ
jgi:ADP-ribose pyrophosphatase YjhB (NUDIX family)